MLKTRIYLAVMLQLWLCCGCAMPGSSQLGLYPSSGFSEVAPLEQRTEWTIPPSNPFDPTKARDELLPILCFGMNSKEKSARSDVFSNLEIQACAHIPVIRKIGKTGSWHGTNTVAVLVSQSDEEPTETEARLVLAGNGALLAAHCLGNGLGNQYSLTLIQSRFERNPSLLLFRDEGGNTRDFSCEMYRVEDGDLRCLKWDGDGQTTSTSKGYSYSNVDFSGLISGKKNVLRVYTTSGNRRAFEEITERDLLPLYKRTTFSWSTSSQSFVPESTWQRRASASKH